MILQDIQDNGSPQIPFFFNISESQRQISHCLRHAFEFRILLPKVRVQPILLFITQLGWGKEGLKCKGYCKR